MLYRHCQSDHDIIGRFCFRHYAVVQPIFQGTKTYSDISGEFPLTYFMNPDKFFGPFPYENWMHLQNLSTCKMDVNPETWVAQ